MKSKPERRKQVPKSRPTKKKPPRRGGLADVGPAASEDSLPARGPNEFDYRTLGPPPSARRSLRSPQTTRSKPTSPPSQNARKPRSEPLPARDRSLRTNDRRPVADSSGEAPPTDNHKTVSRTPEVATLHVASLEVLAKAAIQVAKLVENAVYEEGKRADRSIAFALKNRRDLAAPDQRFIAQAVFALFRWNGWLRTLNILKIEERLLLAWLLDSTTIHPVCRVWGHAIGRETSRLVPIGDAPNWTIRAEALKRWTGGRGLNVDPWKLVPGWVREHLPKVDTESGTSPKTRYLELLDRLQRPAPLWVRAQTANPKQVWNELRQQGIKPWLHREIETAAKLDSDVEIYRLPAYERGEIEIQDLASQMVGLVCDPDPGERWWDACAGAGGKALHLAGLMGGRGVVVATDSNEYRLKEAARRARKSPFRNLTTKLWDGKHVAGKPGSFDGVLVDAPCSGIGTWRRNPDARWTLQPEAIQRLADLQLSLLEAAAPGVKAGGTLVYSVCTITPTETFAVVQAFLKKHPEFKLDPFTHPTLGTINDGRLLIWPDESDTDAMFITRMTKVSDPKPNLRPRDEADGQ